MATVTIEFPGHPYALVVDVDRVEATEIAAEQARRGRRVRLDLRDAEEDAA